MGTSMSQSYELGYPDIILGHLESSFSQWGKSRLEAFLKQRSVNKWIIASDYCIRDKDRPNDSFVFVIMPAGTRLEETEKHINHATKRDLKKSKKIPDSLSRLIKNGKVFSFCFVVDRDRSFFRSIDEVRSALDLSIEKMEAWTNADECQPIIKSTKKFRSELNKASVNKNLVTDIILSALFCSFITKEIQRISPSIRIGWMSDRDKIVEYGENIAYSFWSINTHALCLRSQIETPILDVLTQKDGDEYNEKYIRIADYVAGVAAWDPPIYAKISKKIQSLIEKLFADNRYLCLYRVAFNSVAAGQFSVKINRLSINGSKSRQKRVSHSSNVTSLRGVSKNL